MMSLIGGIILVVIRFGNFKLSNCFGTGSRFIVAAMSSAARQSDFDVAIIGGGSGGYAAARTSASQGLRTVVIEGGTEVGGLCILRGCMPTKALLYAAEVRHLAKSSARWGMKPFPVPFDWASVMARKDAVTMRSRLCI